MKMQKQGGNRPAKITPEVLRKLQQAMSDVIKPDYHKEPRKDAPKKKRRNKNKNKEE